ncbi:MAG: POTRA domain-containing protein [Ferruginibacter sp.]
MQRIYQNFFLLFLILTGSQVLAQDSTELKDIYDQKYPREYTIAGITVSGTRAFDPNLIISISGLAVGDVVKIPGTDAFSGAIEKLWKQSLVSNVFINLTKLEGSNLYIEIELVERPRLIEFNIIGVKKGERDDLEPKMGLAKDRVLTENMKLSALEVIQKHYYDKGYRNVDIKMVEQEIAGISNGVRLNFFVTKGKKVKINSINFAGNENVSDNKLKKQMKGTKEMMRFTLAPEKIISPYGDTKKPLTIKQYFSEMAYLKPTRTKEYLDPYIRIKLGGGKFSEKKYTEDKEKIVNYYNAQGFRDALILADTQVQNTKGNLDLHLKLSEGRKYYFGNITWKGNTKYSDSVLNLLLGIKKGDPYNLETLNKRVGKELSMEGGDIGSLYQDDGYLFFQAEPVETSVYNDTIDFEIRMREGSQATYDKITVSGNDKTKDYVILRELRTIPGNKYRREDIIRTQRELSQLGFLDAEKIVPQVVPNAENGTVDINWQVEEKSADQLELSAGFGGGIGLTGTLGVTFNNFSIKNITKKSSWDPLPAGDGQKLSARIQSNGKAYRSYSFSFTEPWLGGKKRNSFSVSYYDTKFANTFSGGVYCRACGDTSYVKTIGFGISLGKQLKWPDDFFNLIYSLNIQQYKLVNYPLFTDPKTKQTLEDGRSTNISLKIALVRNSAGPNPIFPTSGSSFSLSGQFTLPYSLIGIKTDNVYKFPEFHKWRFNGEWYVPIGRGKGPDRNKQFILKAAAKYGFLGRYNPDMAIAPFERFQVGDAGLSNTQAFLGYDIIAHRGYPVYSNSNPRINPDGVTPQEYFTIFNKYTMELRYPFSTSASSTIYGLAFFEAANGWYQFKDYNPFKLRRSAGLGMRFFLPMFGLLGFDYGIGFDRYNQTSGLKGAAKFTFMLGQEPE